MVYLKYLPLALLNLQLSTPLSSELSAEIAQRIKTWAHELGFAHVGICDTNVQEHEAALKAWLKKGYHGDMAFMERHTELRLNPAQLVPETVRIISVGMQYLPPDAQFAHTLADPSLANISRYATGRDYHKLMRKRLKQLALRIEQDIPELNYRLL